MWVCHWLTFSDLQETPQKLPPNRKGLDLDFQDQTNPPHSSVCVFYKQPASIVVYFIPKLKFKTPSSAMSSAVKLLILVALLTALPLASAQNTPNNPNEGNYPYTRFSPSMAIIIVILIAALFLMGFFSIYIRNCSQANRSSPTVRLGGGRNNAGARGLDVETIATFPTMVYSEVKGLKIGKGALECAVCLNEFEDDETLRFIPKCDHVFHPDCIDAWLASHTTCPVCRANLLPQPGDPVGQPALPIEAADLEAQNDGVSEPELNTTVDQPEPEVIEVGKTLNRNRTRGRGSRSGRPPKFSRSHSTGHSLVQPGDNTDRFTLRLPADVRKQIMERELSRSSSMVLPRGGGGSSRRGEGSSRGKYFRRPERLARSERWSFNRMPSFLRRAPSVKSPSIKSPKVAAITIDVGQGQSSSKRLGELVGESSRPPV